MKRGADRYRLSRILLLAGACFLTPAVGQAEGSPEVLVDYDALDVWVAPAPAGNHQVLPAPADPPASQLFVPQPAAREPRPEAPAAPPSEATGPQAAPAIEPAAGEDPSTQVAAASPPENVVTLPFEQDSDELSDAVKETLELIALDLTANRAAKVQILAYASGDRDTASKARRLSLARALVVRAYLSDRGVAIGRMDVRALGIDAEGEPADRVDIVPQTL